MLVVRLFNILKLKKELYKEGSRGYFRVNRIRRSNICKNHTATHMLHSALKKVVGDHINQAGSYVDDERLRFDFTHFQGLSKEELEKVETLVNEKIMEVYNVGTKFNDIR